MSSHTLHREKWRWDNLRSSLVITTFLMGILYGTPIQICISCVAIDISISSSNGEYMPVEGGGGTLGAHWLKTKESFRTIYITDANCFQIVEISELPWGSKSTCLGSAGSLQRSPNPPFHFYASAHAETRLGTCHDNDMFSGVISLTLY